MNISIVKAMLFDPWGLIADTVMEEKAERVHDVYRHKAFTASEQKHFVLCEQIYFGEGKL